MKFSLMVTTPEVTEDGSYVRTPLGPYDDVLPLAAALGFDSVEVMSATPQPGHLRDLRAALARTGLHVSGFNSGRLFFDEQLTLLQDDDASRAAFGALVQAAASYRAHINIGMFRGLPADMQAGRQRLVTLLQAAAGVAASSGVDLLLEPSNCHELPFICTTDEGLEVVAAVDRPNVGLMLDTFHMVMAGENPAESARRALPYVRHIHLLDLKRNPPDATCTDFDVPAFVRALADAGYAHALAMPLVKDAHVSATADALQSLRALV